MNERQRNLHHISFEKNQHRTGAQRLYRGMGLMAVRMDIQAHRDLHHEIPRPPLPPTGAVLRLGIDSVRRMMTDGVQDPLRVVNTLIDEYGALAFDADDQKTANEAMRHEQFLIDQYPFIQKGRPRYERTD